MNSMNSEPSVWREQSRCPVTGEPLGSRGPAVKVQIVQEYREPSTFWQRNMSRWFPPEVKRHTDAFFVCCPGCVERAKADPSGSYLKVYADRRGLTK